MRALAKLFILALALILLLGACGSSSYSGSSNSSSSAASTSSQGAVVKSASSSIGTILTDSQGMTLYHLGGEQGAKFICTGSCLGVWHPLTVSAGSEPSGEVGSLGVLKRPEGSMQVTYKGMPLYTFAQDEKPGDTKGQGIKDVGTWSALVSSTGSSSSSTPPSTSTPSSSSSGGGSNYSY
ncbi:MAG: COG4315 family predicted lipoprotein [Solirubrobacteraceae bacterium]